MFRDRPWIAYLLAAIAAIVGGGTVATIDRAAPRHTPTVVAPPSRQIPATSRPSVVVTTTTATASGSKPGESTATTTVTTVETAPAEQATTSAGSAVAGCEGVASSCGDPDVCDGDFATHCASELGASQDSKAIGWAQAAASHGWRNASWKYARTDCLRALATDPACVSFGICHDGLNSKMVKACVSGPCAGVTPGPCSSGSCTQVEDCVAAHLKEMSAACLSAYCEHEADRLSSARP